MKRVAPPLVSCEWLASELKSTRGKNLRIVDSTWFLPDSPFRNVSKDSAEDLFLKKKIPGAVFLDIDRVGDVSFTNIPVPHNLPKDASFLTESLDLDPEDHVIVYDQLGIFSSARGMFTIQAFGHSNVSVLNGGLPMWIKLGLPIHSDGETSVVGGPAMLSSPKQEEKTTKRRIKKKKRKNTDLQWTLENVKCNIQSKKYQLVDVRPSPRYHGKMKEKRPNTRSGHVPGSFNVRSHLTSLMLPRKRSMDKDSNFKAFKY